MSFEEIQKKICTDFRAKKIEGAHGSEQRNRILLELEIAHILAASRAVVAMENSVRLLFVTAAYVDSNLYWVVELAGHGDALLSLRSRLDLSKEIPSLASVWSYADWQEREAAELFGVKFIGSINNSESFLLRSSRIQFPHRRQ